MSGPSLGVAIPSFEQPDYVGEAIGSLRQLRVPFEAVIQDAGSSEGTLEKLRTAIGDDDRIRLIVEPDSGQADAMNRAWRRLMGRHDYLTWFNTDDVMYPEGVATLIEFLEGTPRAVLAYGDLDAIDERGQVVGWARAPRRVRRIRLVYHHNLVPGICPVVRSSAIWDVGMFDEELHFAMDHDLFVRLARVGRLQRVPVNVAGYRTHGEAKTWGDKAASESEVARVRARYRRLPVPIAEVVRLVLRLAWWPVRRRYSEGEMRLSARQLRA